MKIEFEKEMVLGLIDLFGEEKAIEELISVCRTVIEESIKQHNEEVSDAKKEMNKLQTTPNSVQ